MATDYDVGLAANKLYTDLLDGENINFPTIDPNDPIFNIPEEGEDSPLNKPQQALDNCALTTRKVGGDGTFDFLMSAVNAHLETQFKAGRITGAEFSKVYVASLEAAMSNATQFLINRDQAYWSAVIAKYQALAARVGLVTARAELSRTWFSALSEKANFTYSKARTLSEGTAARTAMWKWDFDVPVESEILKLQKIAAMETNTGLELQNQTTEYNLTKILSQQYTLLVEQTEAQRAQTLDTRSDGATVVGVLGVQKDLHKQQIQSYKRDAEYKVARSLIDSWIAQKTIDEALTPPTTFSNASIDARMTQIFQNNNL